jgi:HlyD family secretion protein
LALPYKKTAAAVISLALIAGLAYYYLKPKQLTPAERYVTVNPQRGEIVQEVSANGTLNPITLVSVGTQVSGIVKHIYVDFNSAVKEGDILMTLDPSLLEAQVQQSQAGVVSAQSALDLARANTARTRALYGKSYVAKQDLDQAVQAEESAAAALKQAQALARKDKTNLGYTIIRSPISGVVVAREVDEGQTVAASFQTPELFKIAQDLSKMRIYASVAEADVGGIKMGQSAHFTVDAYPGRTYSGTVSQVRLNPTTVQNVVTYTVVVDAANPGELLPGMTAYVDIRTAEKKDALKVPNAALRFKPANMSETTVARPKNVSPGTLTGTVYKLGAQGIRPIQVTLGMTDGKFTEITSDNLTTEDKLVTEDKTPDAKTGPSGGTPLIGPPRGHASSHS